MNQQFDNKTASAVNSIYLDCPQDMSLYELRKLRADGARLVRIRWYGSIYQMPDVVYLEMKTHRKGALSTKDRFKIRSRDLPYLLWQPEKWWAHYNVEQQRQKKQQQKIQAEQQTPAQQLQSGKRLAEGYPGTREFIRFVKQVQKLSVTLGLRPVLITVCLREHFQENSVKTVRMTLDTSLHMLKVIHEEERLMNDPREWNIVRDGAIYNFPFAILELKASSAWKTADEKPFWVKRIEEMGIKAERYSKYIQGAHALYGAEKELSLPPWLHKMELLQVYPDFIKTLERQYGLLKMNKQVKEELKQEHEQKLRKFLRLKISGEVF